MLRRVVLGTIAYTTTTFPLAYVWHLVLFDKLYLSLGGFGREEPIIALGFLTILIQGALFAVVYPRFRDGESWVRDGLRFGAFTGAFLWTVQVIAAAAKHPIDPIPTWIGIESLYVAIQFLVIGLLFGYLFRRVGGSAATLGGSRTTRPEG